MDIGTDNAFAKMPAVLVEEFSPTLPPEFPPERIPKDICQKELLYLFKCTMAFGPAMKCHKEYDNFERCKRRRDLELFTQIKSWELENFSKLDESARSNYLQGLEAKMNKLKVDFEKIPFSSLFQNKLWRYSSDIEQLTWRTNYLKKSFPVLKETKAVEAPKKSS